MFHSPLKVTGAPDVVQRPVSMRPSFVMELVIVKGMAVLMRILSFVKIGFVLQGFSSAIPPNFAFPMTKSVMEILIVALMILQMNQIVLV